METIYRFESSDLINPIIIDKKEFDYLCDMGAGKYGKDHLEYISDLTGEIYPLTWQIRTEVIGNERFITSRFSGMEIARRKEIDLINNVKNNLEILALIDQMDEEEKNRIINYLRKKIQK